MLLSNPGNSQQDLGPDFDFAMFHIGNVAASIFRSDCCRLTTTRWFYPIFVLGEEGPLRSSHSLPSRI